MLNTRIALFLAYVTAAAMPSCVASAVPPTCGPDDANPNQAIGAWLTARAACGDHEYADPPWGPASSVTRDCLDALETADCGELEDVAAACRTCVP